MLAMSFPRRRGHSLVARETTTEGTSADVDEAVMRIGGAPPMFTFRDPDGNALRVVQTPAR